MIKPIVNLGESDHSGFQNARLNLPGLEIDAKVKKTGGVFRKALHWIESRTIDRLTNNYVPLQCEGKTYYVSAKDLAKELQQEKKQVVEAFRNERYRELTIEGGASLKEAQKRAEEVLGQKGIFNKATKEQYADVLRIAFQIIGEGHSKQDIAVPVKLNQHQWILADLKGPELKISTIYGEPLGKGKIGKQYQMFDLLKMQPKYEEDALLKTSESKSKDSDTVSHEVRILEKINPDGKSIGIQKPMKKHQIKTAYSTGSFDKKEGVVGKPDFKRTDAVTMAVGPKYNSSFMFNSDEYSSFGHQLFHGLEQIHDAGVVHGNIEPNSLGYSLDEDENPLLFITEFGGAIDYTDSSAELPKVEFNNRAWQIEGRNSGYYLQEDCQALADAQSAEERHKIDKAMDVFAACATFCDKVKNPSDNPPKTSYSNQVMHQYYRDDLEKAGFDQPEIDLLIKGLSHDWKERPTAVELEMVFAEKLYEEIARKEEYFD